MTSNTFSGIGRSALNALTRLFFPVSVIYLIFAKKESVIITVG